MEQHPDLSTFSLLQDITLLVRSILLLAPLLILCTNRRPRYDRSSPSYSVWQSDVASSLICSMLCSSDVTSERRAPRVPPCGRFRPCGPSVWYLQHHLCGAAQQRDRWFALLAMLFLSFQALLLPECATCALLRRARRRHCILLNELLLS